MRGQRRRVGWVLLLGAWTIAIGCGGSSEKHSAPCEAGESRSCPCEHDEDGTQYCEEDGSGWGDCRCGEDGAGGSAGSGSSNDSGGSASDATGGEPSSGGSSAGAGGILETAGGTSGATAAGGTDLGTAGTGNMAGAAGSAVGGTPEAGGAAGLGTVGAGTAGYGNEGGSPGGGEAGEGATTGNGGLAGEIATAGNGGRAGEIATAGSGGEAGSPATAGNGGAAGAPITCPGTLNQTLGVALPLDQDVTVGGYAFRFVGEDSTAEAPLIEIRCAYSGEILVAARPFTPLEWTPLRNVSQGREIGIAIHNWDADSVSATIVARPVSSDVFEVPCAGAMAGEVGGEVLTASTPTVAVGGYRLEYLSSSDADSSVTVNIVCDATSTVVMFGVEFVSLYQWSTPIEIPLDGVSVALIIHVLSDASANVSVTVAELQ